MLISIITSQFNSAALIIAIKINKVTIQLFNKLITKRRIILFRTTKHKILTNNKFQYKRHVDFDSIGTRD